MVKGIYTLRRTLPPEQIVAVDIPSKKPVSIRRLLTKDPFLYCYIILQVFDNDSELATATPVTTAAAPTIAATAIGR